MGVKPGTWNLKLGTPATGRRHCEAIVHVEAIPVSEQLIFPRYSVSPFLRFVSAANKSSSLLIDNKRPFW